MIVIDANTGIEVTEGMTFNNVVGTHYVYKIVPGILRARMLVAIDGGQPLWVPLQVRWIHPAFFFRHVAFIPS